MTIEELVKDNPFINEISVEVRTSDLHLIQWIQIGKDVKHDGFPSNGKERWETLNINLNSKDDGKEYFDIKVERIPKAIRELPVFSWEASMYSNSRQRVRISTLRNAEKIIVKQPAQDGTESDPLQCSLFDGVNDG